MITGKNSQIKTLIFLNRYYRPLLILVVVLVFGLGYWLVLDSSRSEIANKKHDLATTKAAELDNAQQYFIHLKDLQRVIADFQKEYRADIEKLDEVLPTGPKVPELMMQIDALVKKNGFNLAGLNITEEAPGAMANAPLPDQGGSTDEDAIALTLSPVPDNLGVISFDLPLAGSDYPTFKRVLNDIEKHIRIFDVDSFSLTSGQEAGFTLNIKTYYLKENRENMGT